MIMRTFVFIIYYACTLFLINTLPVYAGDIKGKVVIKNPVSPKIKRGLSAFYTKPSEIADDSQQEIEVVVYLKEFPGAPEPVPAHGAQLLQKGKKFVPHILAIPAGTTVDFPNMDDIYHNVFSLSKSNSFSLGKYAAGKSQSRTFNRPGVVEVFCEIHSDMHAFILVLPNNFFAKTDADGNFVLKDVPPGTYTLVAWHETLPQQERTVIVPAEGDIVLNIAF